MDKDFRSCGILTKNLKKLRKTYNLSDALLVLQFYMPDLFNRLKLQAQPTALPVGVSTEDHLHCTQSRSEVIMRIPET